MAIPNCSRKQAIQVADCCWQARVINVYAIMLYSRDGVEINGDASHEEIKHPTYTKKVYFEESSYKIRNKMIYYLSKELRNLLV